MFLPVEKWGLSVAQTASLSGELLESQEALPGNETTVGGACDRDAGTTLSFTTTGAAQGPYVGTFVETGTITIGPQTNTEIDSRGVGAILAFEASFTHPERVPARDDHGLEEPFAHRAHGADHERERALPGRDRRADRARSGSGNAGLVIETAAIPPTTSFLEPFNSTEPPPPDCDEDEQGDEDCQGEDEQ